MAETVSNLGCDITIIGRKKADCIDSEEIPFRTKRFKMLFRRGFLFYKWFNIRLFFYLFFHKYDILVANDLDTLLPAFLVSKLKHIPLVYDSHEYFTGVPEIQKRPFVKSVWDLIERSIFPRLKYVITVSEPIASLYEKMYNVKPVVIRNFSKNADHITPFLRKQTGVADDDLLLIIQGTGINIDKGSEELLAAVKMTSGVSLLIIGSGDVVPELKRLAGEMNITDRVRFINSVPWETLIKYTKSADLGMCLEKDTNLNYKYSLPNKLFDYISAGIPVIVGELPETGKIIRETGCGMSICRITPENISSALSELKNNPARLANLKKNAVEASKKLNWEYESEKVKELYIEVLRHNGITA